MLHVCREPQILSIRPFRILMLQWESSFVAAAAFCSRHRTSLVSLCISTENPGSISSTQKTTLSTINRHLEKRAKYHKHSPTQTPPSPSAYTSTTKQRTEQDRSYPECQALCIGSTTNYTNGFQSDVRRSWGQIQYRQTLIYWIWSSSRGCAFARI